MKTVHTAAPASMVVETPTDLLKQIQDAWAEKHRHTRKGFPSDRLPSRVAQDLGLYPPFSPKLKRLYYLLDQEFKSTQTEYVAVVKSGGPDRVLHIRAKSAGSAKNKAVGMIARSLNTTIPDVQGRLKVGSIALIVMTAEEYSKRHPDAVVPRQPPARA